MVTNQTGTCNEMHLLAAGQSCDVLVTYTGVFGGSKGSIFIDDSASNSPQKVTLTGFSHGICVPSGF